MTMAASVQFRPQNRDLGMVMREVDEDLAIFLGIRNSERETNDRPLVEECDEFDDSKSEEPKPDSFLTLNASLAETFPTATDDNFLNLEMEKIDKNWLLMQSDTLLLPSAEADLQDSAASQTKISNDEGISLKSELENNCEVSASLSDNSPKLETSSGERKPTRRAATPTGRPSMPVKSKPSRPSTPTSRATLPSSKPVAAQGRSSTPVRPTSRSSTPASRPSIPVISKSTLRSATPTRKPSTPSTTSTISASDRSSSGRKPGSTILKSSGPSRGTSPTVKSRPSKSSEMLSLSQDAPQNPTVSMPKRPASATRGRLSAPATHSSSSNEKPRQRSCSPATVRAPISTGYKTGSKVLPRSRGCSNDGDDVNPVAMGTKMVDRVVNMRKLAPPKQEEYVFHDNPRKSAQENSGFGRSLSKKSLDMAIRHMDIRRSVPDKLRTSATGSGKKSRVGVLEPPATSNCDS